MTPTDLTVLLGDPRLPDRSKPGGRFTADDFDQVVRLKSALAELTEYRFEYLDDHDSLLDRLRARPPALVLNFCDLGYRNEARHELHLPAYLEMLGIPYSGSGPVTLGLCYDKGFVRAVAREHGVPVPEEAFIAATGPLPALGYPAFIKPNRGDGSLGISARSIVHDAAQADACVAELREQLPGVDLIAQEFLSGTEYGVGLVGNPADGFTVLPMLEVDYDALDPALPRLLDYGSKSDPTSPYWNDVRFREARVDAALRERVAGWCRTLFARLDLRDYARFDFRADAAGALKLMEINPNPAWCWDGKLAHMVGVEGGRHADLLRLIVEAARRRCFPLG